MKDMDPEELTQAIAAGKADHEEVLKAGEEAAADLQGLIHALIIDIKDEDAAITSKPKT
ncbi:MAG: hypothetical protein Q9180_000018 [Flavoplaca navasiana]